ncbi:hypothetical protein F511_15673 [Dorcoceras hygrometricum]|uniref:Uncharacterized protein n=1 Tax=Dorcoceras hygrometricum TaxID=472368 RepID=A0A2Z7BPE5_9LAMI|nr:hypothetical protein F511_15673 [Dorcoceras hygrometricum]
MISTLVGNLSSLLWSGTYDLYSGREPVISTLDKPSHPPDLQPSALLGWRCVTLWSRTDDDFEIASIGAVCGNKKESENAAKEEQSAIVENIDVQEEADDTGTSINQRKTLNLGGRVAYTQGLLCPSLLMIIQDKPPHPARKSLLILLGQTFSSSRPPAFSSPRMAMCNSLVENR